MTLERITRKIDDGLVMNKFAAKTAAYSMTIRDQVIDADISASSFAFTLPNVSEAEGKIFVVRVSVSIGGLYTLTIQDNNESGAWENISLTQEDDFVAFYSDGRSYRIFAQRGAEAQSDSFIETFKSAPNSSSKSGSAATGTGGDENVMCFQGGNVLEYHILGTQTILSPQLAATGLDVGMDQADNDGVEICTGILASNLTFVIGADKAFFAKCRFSIANVSGTDDCAFGFRLAEAYQANIDDYNDSAVLNVISGNITIETIIGDASTVVTDTTNNWADTAIHTLEIRVSSAGVVTYLIDGAAPVTVAAYTFTDAIVVVPYFHFLQANADQTGALVLEHFECGPQ
jgi:hypothetical protein